MDDTWFLRELPVLDALVREIDNTLVSGTYPQLSDIAEITGLEIIDVGKAAMALNTAKLIKLQMTMTGGDPGPWPVTEVSGTARQLVGAWPSPENLARNIYQQIQKLSTSEDDPIKSSWIRNFLGQTSEMGKDIVVDLLSSAILKSFHM